MVVVVVEGDIRMQKEVERAVHAEWRSKTDREGLAIGRVRKLER